MGIAYKENVSNTRETPVINLIIELQSYGIKVAVFYPLVNNIRKQFGVKAIKILGQLTNIDCLKLAVYHNEFHSITITDIKTIMNNNPILVYIRGVFYRLEEAINTGFQHYINL